MAEIKVGDRVRVKDRREWPSPPGFRLANSEGRVSEVMDGGFIGFRLEKTEADKQLGLDVGMTVVLRLEHVEKL